MVDDTERKYMIFVIDDFDRKHPAMPWMTHPLVNVKADAIMHLIELGDLLPKLG